MKTAAPSLVKKPKRKIKTVIPDSIEYKEREEYFVCECEAPQHSFTFHDMTDIDGKWTDPVYINIHMAQCYPWYKRIWYAIKYVFGYKSRYGDWDTILLKENDLVRLRNLLDEAIKERNL